MLMAIPSRFGRTAALSTGPFRTSTRWNFRNSISFSKPRPKLFQKRTVDAADNAFTGSFTDHCGSVASPTNFLAKRMTHDFAIIGAGIVGLATAREILRARPHASILILEKESAVA